MTDYLDEAIQKRLYHLLYQKAMEGQFFPENPEFYKGGYVGNELTGMYDIVGGKRTPWTNCIKKMKGVPVCDRTLYYDEEMGKCTYPNKIKKWDKKSRDCKMRREMEGYKTGAGLIGGRPLNAWQKCLKKHKDQGLSWCELPYYYDKTTKQCLDTPRDVDSAGYQACLKNKKDKSKDYERMDKKSLVKLLRECEAKEVVPLEKPSEMFKEVVIDPISREETPIIDTPQGRGIILPDTGEFVSIEDIDPYYIKRIPIQGAGIIGGVRRRKDKRSKKRRSGKYKTWQDFLSEYGRTRKASEEWKRYKKKMGLKS